MKYELTSDTWQIPKGSIFVEGWNQPNWFNAFGESYVVLDEKGSPKFSVLKSRVESGEYPELKEIK